MEAGCVDENDPLFTFTFPDGTTTGPATTAVTLEPTAAGLDYVKELMMQEGKYKNDSTVYTNDSLWVNGLLRPGHSAARFQRHHGRDLRHHACRVGHDALRA